MESIAVTKPNIGILSQERLVLSPFGALAQAFSEELLSRSGYEEGHWPFVPLDLLEEREITVPSPPVQPVLHMDLNLVLQALRQIESKTERERVTERIVERIIRLREREYLRTAIGSNADKSYNQNSLRRATLPQELGTSVQTTQAQRPGTAQQTHQQSARDGDRGTATTHERTPIAQYPFALQQSFYSTVNQHIWFTNDLRQSFFAQPDRVLHSQSAPGGLGKRSQAFSLRLQRLREEGHIVPDMLVESADALLLPTEGQALSPDGARIADRQNVRRVVSEELSFLERSEEDGTAREVSVADRTAAIYRGAQRIAQQIGEEITAQMAASTAKQAVDMRPDRQASGISKTVRPTQIKLENTTSEGKTHDEGLSDGLHIDRRSAKVPGQAGTVSQMSQFSHEGLRIDTKETAFSHSSEDDTPPSVGEQPSIRRGDSVLSEQELLTSSVRDIRMTVQESLDTAVKGTEGDARDQIKAPDVSPTFVQDPELTYRMQPEGERAEEAHPSVPASTEGHHHISVEKVTSPHTSKENMSTSAGEQLSRRRGESMLSEQELLAPSVRDIRMTGKENLDAAVKRTERDTQDQIKAPDASPTFVQDPELTYLVQPEGERAEEAHPSVPAGTEGHAHISTEKVAPPHTSKEVMSPSIGEEPLIRRGESMLSEQELLTPSVRDIRLVRESVLDDSLKSTGKIAQTTEEEQTISAIHITETELAHYTPHEFVTGEALHTTADAIHPKDRQTKHSDHISPYPELQTQQTDLEIPYETGSADKQQTEHGVLPQRAAKHMRTGLGRQKPLATTVQDIRTVSKKSTADEIAVSLQQVEDRRDRSLPAGIVPSDELILRDGSGQVEAAPLNDMAAAESQQHGMVTSAQDIRVFSADWDTPAEDKSTQKGPAAAAIFAQEIISEDLAHRTAQLEYGAADAPSEIRPITTPPHTSQAQPKPSLVSETTRVVQQDYQNADTRLRQRLADQMHLSQQAARSGQSGAVQHSAFQGGTQMLESTMPLEPLELAYGISGASGHPEALAQSTQLQGRSPAQSGMDSPFVRSLPEWAQRFLREGAPQTQAEATHKMGTARDISTLTLPEQFESVEEWTAPHYQVPDQITYRERPEQKVQQVPRQEREIRISDAEIQRTADRVYQIIEERIRQERRRLGL